MSLRQTFANPFYLLLLVAGVVFSVTACAYGVMTVRGLHPSVTAGGPGESLMQWLDENGFQLMLGELAALGMFCGLAIATDGYWEKRCAQRSADGEDRE